MFFVTEMVELNSAISVFYFKAWQLDRFSSA